MLTSLNADDFIHRLRKITSAIPIQGGQSLYTDRWEHFLQLMDVRTTHDTFRHINLPIEGAWLLNCRLVYSLHWNILLLFPFRCIWTSWNSKLVARGRSNLQIEVTVYQNLEV